MIREFFYLQKSDRKVILTLLCVIVIAMGVIFLTGGEEETNGLMPVDTLRKEVHRDTARRYEHMCQISDRLQLGMRIDLI